MFKRSFLTALLVLSLTLCKAQNLTNSDLLKTYGLLLNAIEQPQSKFIDVLIKSVNLKLRLIDSKWSQLDRKDILYGENELFFHWMYPHPETNVLNLNVTIKSIQLNLVPSVAYITPHADIFYQNLKEINSIGRYIGQSKNELKGIDKRFKVGTIVVVYSTFPPSESGATLNNKPTTTYKISIGEQ